MNCPLCGETNTRAFQAQKRSFHKCGTCRLVFADPVHHLSSEALKERYLLHENSLENKGYRDFLMRAVVQARPYFTPGMRGLDYGCGPVPVLSALAGAEGIEMAHYDSLFFPAFPSGLFDIVFSTECFEHFEHPAKEIAEAAALLQEGGLLAVMTEIWDERTDFESWYYLKDPTHISFYTRETLDYLARRFGLAPIAGDGKRVFVFKKARVPAQEVTL